MLKRVLEKKGSHELLFDLCVKNKTIVLIICLFSVKYSREKLCVFRKNNFITIINLDR